MDIAVCAAVVTGGASGLGAATARALAAKGAKVALFDLQADKGEALAAEIGGLFCRVDVTLDESVEAGFAAARAAHGQERILVNCAGTGHAIKTASRSKEDGTIRHHPLDAFDRIMAEDFENMAPIQRSLESPAFRGVPLNYQERRIWHFHEQLDRMLGAELVPPSLRVQPLLGAYVGD